MSKDDERGQEQGKYQPLSYFQLMEVTLRELLVETEHRGAPPARPPRLATKQRNRRHGCDRFKELAPMDHAERINQFTSIH